MTGHAGGRQSSRGTRGKPAAGGVDARKTPIGFGPLPTTAETGENDG